MSFAKIVALATSLTLTYFLPTYVATFLAIAALVILAIRDRELFVAALIAMATLSGFYVAASLAISLASNASTCILRVCSIIVAIVAISFLASTVITVKDLVNVLGSNRLSLSIAIALAILRSVPRARYVAKVILANYGRGKVLKALPVVIGIEVLERSIEYSEQLCLWIPRMCLGGPDRPHHLAANAAIRGR